MSWRREASNEAGRQTSRPSQMPGVSRVVPTTALGVPFVPKPPGSDLLICGILMWGQLGGFGFASDRVDQSQLGAGIGVLRRVEMVQQVRDGAVDRGFDIGW